MENLEAENENIENQELMLALKVSENTILNDPLNNNTIKNVVQMGFHVDLVVQAYTAIGDFPDLIINYIYDNYY